jgi:hypothetical protein
MIVSFWERAIKMWRYMAVTRNSVSKKRVYTWHKLLKYSTVYLMTSLHEIYSTLLLSYKLLSGIHKTHQLLTNKCLQKAINKITPLIYIMQKEKCLRRSRSLENWAKPTRGQRLIGSFWMATGICLCRCQYSEVPYSFLDISVPINYFFMSFPVSYYLWSHLTCDPHSYSFISPLRCNSWSPLLWNTIRAATRFHILRFGVRRR